MHDPDKVLLGSTLSSDRHVNDIESDPATFFAGHAVRLKSDGKLSLAKVDGGFYGVSLGKSLSDIKYTSVCRAGSAVPIILTDDEDDYAYVVKGQKVWIDDVTGHAQAEAGGDIDSTLSDAVYVSGPLDGVRENGQIIKVALIDMVGGL
jgi:hypothetical protein